MQGSGERKAGLSGKATPLTRIQILNMCCGLFGVQVVWGLQNVNTSRILQTLGAGVDELPILWIAAPITGLLVQPVIGYLSDHSWGPLGRRRPYIVAGAVLTAAALIAMPNAESLFAATFILWLLTASINVAMEPFRALVADTLPPEQRTSGFAAQVFFIGLGAVFAAALPWVLSHWFGVSGQAEAGRLPPSVRMSFAIGAVALLAAVGWSVFTTSERPPECLEADPLFDTEHPVPTSTGAAILARSGGLWLAGGCALGFAAIQQGWGRELQLVAAIAIAFGLLQVAAVLLRRAGHSSIGMIEIVEDILHMPVVLRRLALVQFFTWFGMFALWVYAIPAVAAHHYGTSDPASPAFGESADWVGILFAEYNAVSAFVALALPSLVARIGRRAAHSLALLLGAAGFAGFVLIDAPGLLWLPAIGIGCAWASILSLPYAMLADAVPPRKMGVYMGVHNIFLVLPQLVAAALLGFLVRAVFNGEAILALALAAGSLALAAALTFTIPAREEMPES